MGKGRHPYFDPRRAGAGVAVYGKGERAFITLYVFAKSDPERRIPITPMPRSSERLTMEAVKRGGLEAFTRMPSFSQIRRARVMNF